VTSRAKCVVTVGPSRASGYYSRANGVVLCKVGSSDRSKTHHPDR
jgi:hypothetical protein